MTLVIASPLKLGSTEAAWYKVSRLGILQKAGDSQVLVRNWNWAGLGPDYNRLT